jgi:hypothetical protein
MLAAVRSRNAAARFPGRVALVVGGTAGIGRAVALRLAEAQYRVFVVGRDEARGAEVVAECSAASGPLGEAHEFIRCDASLLSACRATAADVAARVPALDALVLSQGIASMAGFTPTAEGIDVKLALHYFGRVAFVQALLPLLRAAPSPRVLAVLSAGVHGTYAHSVDDFELRQRFSIKNAAGRSWLLHGRRLGLAQPRGGQRARHLRARGARLCRHVVGHGASVSDERPHARGATLRHARRRRCRVSG